MEKVLVTGGTGFIGGAIAMKLSQMGYEVTALSRLSNAHKEMEKQVEKEGVKLLKGDVLSESFAGVLQDMKPETIVHAALVVNGSADASEERFKKVNAEGTLRVLEAAKEAGVRQFVFASSMQVYGKPQYLPIDEKHPTNPSEAYGASLKAGELYALKYRGQMKVFIPRIANVYGPGAAWPSIVTRIIGSIRKGERPVIYGDGKQSRDFIYVDDMAEEIALGVKKKLDLTLNIASGRETTLLELAAKIAKLMGSEIKPSLLPDKSDAIGRMFADVSAAKKLGLSAKTGLDEGLRRLIDSS